MSTPTNDLSFSLLARAHSPTTAQRIHTERILHRPLHLRPSNPNSNPQTTTNTAQTLRRETRLSKSKKSKPNPLSSRQKRTLQIHTLPHRPTYTNYIPLHNLWISYIQSLLNLSPTKRNVGGSSEAAKLCSADFHGAELEVVRSRCVGRVGLRGVVVKDLVGVFEVVVKGKGKGKDRKVVIPKEGTVFRFRIPLVLGEEGDKNKNETEGNGEGKEEDGDKMELDIDGNGNNGRKPSEQDDPNADKKATPPPKPRELVFELHGDQFKYRAADRANRKFKAHFLKDL